MGKLRPMSRRTVDMPVLVPVAGVVLAATKPSGPDGHG